MFFASIVHEDHNVLDLLNAELHIPSTSAWRCTTRSLTSMEASSGA